MIPHPLPLDQALGRLRPRRQFDSTRVLPEPILTTILALASQVPSWNDLQPWRFLVVREESNRRRLRTCVFDRQEVVDASVVVIVLAYLYPERSYLERLLEEQLNRGHLTPAEAAKTRGMTQRKLERIEDPAAWASHPAYRAETALLIAAESMGVASAPVEEFDASKLARAFGIPDDHVPCSLVALGYSAREEPEPPRLPLYDICYREHFGQPWSPEET